jgi:hypothetical protein
LDVITMIFEGYREAVKVQNNSGFLPLHYALQYNAPSAVIDMICKEYPEAAAVQQNEGCLPLHLALWYKAPSDIITMIFKAHPKAVEIKNKDGKTPIDIALSLGILCAVLQFSHDTIKEEETTDNYISTKVPETQIPSTPKSINDTSGFDEEPQQHLPLKDKMKELELSFEDEPSSRSPGRYNEKIIQPITTNGQIQALLQELVGVYNNPSRISLDAEKLLESFTFTPHLSSIAEHPNVLSLEGTFLMTNRGVEYNIPVEILLPPDYPSHPPVCYMRPAKDIILNENNQYVGSDGRIDMPYLQCWKHDSCNLVHLIMRLVN